MALANLALDHNIVLSRCHRKNSIEQFSLNALKIEIVIILINHVLIYNMSLDCFLIKWTWYCSFLVAEHSALSWYPSFLKEKPTPLLNILKSAKPECVCIYKGLCAFLCEIVALSVNKLTSQKYITPALFHVFTSEKKSQAPFIRGMASQFISISCRAQVTSESE